MVSRNVSLVQSLVLRTLHLRFGHLGEAGIRESMKRNLIKLDNGTLGFCTVLRPIFDPF